MKSYARFARGFTLIELMVGITILAIIMGLGVPSYQIWIQNSKIRNAAESILNGMQLARSEAVARNSSVQFTLGAGSAWTVCLLAGDDCSETIQSRTSGEGSSAAVTVVTTPIAQTKVVFNSLARSVTPTGASIIDHVDIDINAAVLPAADSRNLRILIGGGGLKMCDPNVIPPDSRAC